jgi:hypothetical protein
MQSLRDQFFSLLAADTVGGVVRSEREIGGIAPVDGNTDRLGPG